MSELQEHINEEVKKTLELHSEHLAIANREMGDIKIGLEGVKIDLSWLKRAFWIVAGSSVGGLLTGLINLLFK